MKLDVLPAETPDTQWYAEGLRFTCTQCGNCCTGPTGFVWVSDVEITRLAEHLKLTPEAVEQKYCRRVAGRLSFRERRTSAGNFDCIFLKEQPPRPSADGKVVDRAKACSIYSMRPLQCRTWPFWPENLSSSEAWKYAGRRCHGMDAGTRHFTLPKIQSLRDARDWPVNPPTSGGKRVSGNSEGS